MARVGDLRMTEPGSQVSSEGRNVPNLVLQEEERSGSVAIRHAHQREKQICFDFFLFYLVFLESWIV